MFKKIAYLLLIIGVIFIAKYWYSGYITEINVQKLKLGDTKEEVIKKMDRKHDHQSFRDTDFILGKEYHNTTSYYYAGDIRYFEYIRLDFLENDSLVVINKTQDY